MAEQSPDRKAHPGLATQHISPTPWAPDTHRSPPLVFCLFLNPPQKKPYLLSPTPGRNHNPITSHNPCFVCRINMAVQQPTKSRLRNPHGKPVSTPTRAQSRSCSRTVPPLTGHRHMTQRQQNRTRANSGQPNKFRPGVHKSHTYEI